jgi:hypothetical protein
MTATHSYSALGSAFVTLSHLPVGAPVEQRCNAQRNRALIRSYFDSSDLYLEMRHREDVSSAVGPAVYRNVRTRVLELLRQRSSSSGSHKAMALLLENEFSTTSCRHYDDGARTSPVSPFESPSARPPPPPPLQCTTAPIALPTSTMLHAPSPVVRAISKAKSEFVQHMYMHRRKVDR